MSVAPSTWNASDFLTARRLNADLFSFDGSNFFQPNGLHWHAHRPVYAAFTAAGGGIVPNWQVYPTPGAYSVIADTSGLYGVSMDPNLTFSLVQDGPPGSGGTAASAGGYWLVMGHAPQQQGSTGTFGAGLGPSGGGSASVAGTFQQQSSHQSGSPFCLDIMDVQAGDITTWLNSSDAFINTPFVGGDGSGQVGNLQGFWAGVYTGNGQTVSSLPTPVTSWSAVTTANLNNTIRNPLRLLNMPPMARMVSTGTQNVTNNTQTQVTLNSASLDNYSGFATAGGGVYTAPLAGLYLVHGIVSWNGGVTGECATGVSVNAGANGTYWAPSTPLNATGRIGTAKTQMFDLHAGDTLELLALQTTGSTAGLGASGASRLVVQWLGATGTPSPLPTAAPDITFRWQAGTPAGTAAAQLNQLGTNMNFLLQRPYATVYSTSNQTGITVNNRTGLNCYNNVSGIVNGSNGDNYSGWDATNQRYVAPVDGWYLAVQETYIAQPGTGGNPAVAGLFQPSIQGANTWDFRQQQNYNNSGTNAGGSSGVSLYYLRAGDWLRTGVLYNDSTGTTVGTFNGAGRRPHFEICWISG